MAETLALTRFCLLRYWKWTLFLAASVLIGIISSAITMQFSQRLGGNIVGFTVVVTFLPAAFFALALFDYGGLSALESGQSGCSHWILRMPIQSWKIALVPIVLKTLWIIGLWLAFLLTIRLVDSSDFPFMKMMAAGTALAASGIWFSGIAWRPFANGWWRIVALGLAGCLCLGAFISVMIVVDSGNSQAARQSDFVRQYMPFVAIILPVVAYVGGTIYTFRAVEYARTRCQGATPEAPSALLQYFSDAEVDVRREHSSPRRAVIWYTLAQAAPWIRKVAVLWIPIVVACILLLELHVVSVVLVFGITIYAGLFVASNSDAKVNRGRFETSLPSFLAGAPVGTAELAWTRLATHFVILACVFASGALILAGMALWPENREVWWEWATQRASTTSNPDAVLSTGLRWSVGIVFGVNACLLCRWVGMAWIGYSGRESWTVIYASVVGVLAVIAFGIPCAWFLKNATTWDHIQESAIQWLYYLPHLAGTLLALKLISIATATTSLARSKLVSHRAMLTVILGWSIIVLALGFVYSVLIPHPAVTLPWCIVVAVLSVPLGRVLVIPVLLHWNRCR